MVTPILPVTLYEVELKRRGRTILGPVTLTLGGDGITILMGPNGSGKTSLLRAIHGIERISRGTVNWQGETEAVRARQAFVFQSPILMRRTVADCIAYPLRIIGTPKAEARARATEFAAEVGLEGKAELPAKVLSGGEKQKMSLARALIRNPELLLLDEPCANLDGHSTAEIEAILLRARDRGTRIIMSTHDIGQARRLADEVLFLYRGKLMEQTPGPAFFDHPASPEARSHINGDLLL